MWAQGPPGTQLWVASPLAEWIRAPEDEGELPRAIQGASSGHHSLSTGAGTEAATSVSLPQGQWAGLSRSLKGVGGRRLA